MNRRSRNRKIIRKDLRNGVALRKEEGQSLVEFAMILPAALLLFLGMMYLSISFYTRHTCSELAREGTNYAMTRGGTCLTATGTSCTTSQTDFTANFVNTVSLPNIAGSTFGITLTNDPHSYGATSTQGQPVTVTVTYTTPAFIPSWDGSRFTWSAITMGSSSTMVYIN